MRNRRLKWRAMLLAGSLFLLGRDLAATTTYSESEADVYLQCGGNKLCSAWEFRMGDFDGDRFEDLLSPISSGYTTDFGYVVFGGDYPNGGSFPLFRNSRIERTNVVTLVRSAVGDITGDGIEDAFFLVGDRIFCVFGRPTPPALISSIDLTITGLGGLSPAFNSFAFGDVNGDGINDLLIHDSSASVVFGRSSFGSVSSTISVTDPSYCMSILGIDSWDWGGGVASGDVDGDGYDDIVLGDNDWNEGARANAGAVFVIRGRSSFPSTWDLRFSSADWTIVGTSGSYTDVVFVADFTGDGKADLGLKSSNHAVLLSGARVTSLGPKIDLAPGQLNSLTPSVLPGGLFYGNWGIPSDFDGDGRPDLVVRYFQSGYKIALLLSHSFSPGSLLPEILPPPPLHFANWTGTENTIVLGDLNGDGKSDLIYLSETFPLVNVFYGYLPLENPHMAVQPRDSNQARVHLTLSVDGEPAEMKLTGNIMDPAPGVWIPFQQKVDVTLTSEVGEKTITAVFRTSGKRESDSVSATVPLALGEAGASVVTNFLREGGTARFEARLDSAGRLKASVYSREGRLLRTLNDDYTTAGVHVIEWDGANGEGARVAPGIYTVVVDRSGQMDRRRVLVK